MCYTGLVAKEDGNRFLVGIPLAAAFLILVALFALGRLLSFWSRVGLAGFCLLLVATALFMALGIFLRRPSRNPRLRAGAAVLLILGGVAILLMTPFAALALSALAAG